MMYIGLEYELCKYSRQSKLGKSHEYYRKKCIVVLRCDSCGAMFSREKGKLDPKRLSNNYFHVCGNCDPKKFAQKKGVENRKIWDMKASSLNDISKL